MPGEDKRGRLRGEVQLPAQLKMAGGAGEATCAACHFRSFMVVVHSRRSRRAVVPIESAGDLVAVGRKPVKGASVGNIWRVLAEVRIEFCGPGEGSQLIRVSEVDDVRVNHAIVDRLLSFNEPRDGAVERYQVAG